MVLLKTLRKIFTPKSYACLEKYFCSVGKYKYPFRVIFTEYQRGSE